MEWNSVKYIDCMDEHEGLPALKTKSVDLGLTDPLWDVDMKKNKRAYIEGRVLDNAHKVHFNDNTTAEFTKAWFTEYLRICERIILVISDDLVFWFIRNFPEIDPVIVPVIWKNGFSNSRVASKKRRSLYLFYGKFKKEGKLLYDYLAKQYYTSSTTLVPFTLRWGFTSKEKHFNHPSPKGLEIPLHIYKQLKPKSVLDPFAGSGSYLYAAKILNIPFLGYEIDKEKQYRFDIRWRFEQNSIEQWIK